MCVCVLTKFDGESRRELHVTELPQFVEVFVWSNNLQNIQQSAGERERKRKREGGGRERCRTT